MHPHEEQIFGDEFDQIVEANGQEWEQRLLAVLPEGTARDRIHVFVRSLVTRALADRRKQNALERRNLVEQSVQHILFGWKDAHVRGYFTEIFSEKSRLI